MRTKLVWITGIALLLTAISGFSVTDTNIASAKVDANADFVVDDTTTEFRVSGRVTSPHFSETETWFFIQDTNDDVGVLVYFANEQLSTSTYAPGVEVQARGIMDQYNGLRRLNLAYSFDASVTDPTIALVTPVESTITNLLLDAERYEGTLVTVTGVTVSGSWPSTGNNANLTIDDGSASMTMRIEGILDLDGQLAPTNAVTLTGIFSQYDTSTPPDGGYQILPRSYADIVQSADNQPPQLVLSDSGPISTAPGLEVAVDLVGQDRNGEDTLVMAADVSPGGSFTDNGDRTGSWAWTPGSGDANTTNVVTFSVTDGTLTNTTDLTIIVLSEELGNVRINEILYDPSNVGMDGDANGDGIYSYSDDEFVEIANMNTNTIDISAWELRVGTNALFTFPANTILTGECAAVVFGGGTASADFGNALAFISTNWSGLVNRGNTVALFTDSGTQIDSIDYGPLDGNNQSVTRNPDGTGTTWISHPEVVSWLLQSPGRLNTGGAFPGSGLTNTAPLIAPVDTETVSVGSDVQFSITASDPEGNAISFAVNEAPTTATLVDNGNGTGTLSYTGEVADAGTIFDIVLEATDGNLTNNIDFQLNVTAGTYSGLVINEFINDPDASGVEIDSNQDGVYNNSDDEFIEIVNTTTNAIDLTGFQISYDALLTVRHTFTAETLDPNGAIVVFGGGSLALFPHPPAQLASAGYLGFGNSGTHTIYLLDDSGVEIDRVTYLGDTDTVDGTSATRYPDGTGDWTNSHYAATGFTGLRASPGTKVDGSVFLTNQPPIVAVDATATATEGLLLELSVTASEPDNELVTLTASNLPANATFYPTNDNGSAAGTLAFTPDSGQVGSDFTVYFIASDSNGTNESSCVITVEAAPSTGPEALPIFEDFEDQDWERWTAVSVTGDQIWYIGSYSGNYFAKMSGYSGGSNENEDWLISPPMDFTAQDYEVMEFISMRDYDGTELAVLVSTNYADFVGLPNSATWSALSPVLSTDAYESVESGILDLSSFDGTNVFVAFKYVSTTTASATYEIDDINIYNNSPNLPILVITNPASDSASVANAVDTYDVQGTANSNIVGSISWTNALTGGNGTLSAVASWSQNVTLDVGENVITVRGTNSTGDASTDSVSITRQAPTSGNQLLISEVADPASSYQSRFVEIYNPNGTNVDLAGENWHLVKQSNGGSYSSITLTGTISATGTYVVAYNLTNFQTSFGTDPDQVSGNISGNGDDAYILYRGGDQSSGTLIDIYGVIDQDGSGYDWEYLDARAVRNSDITAPNTTWTASEWTITDGAALTEFTPGVHPDASGAADTDHDGIPDDWETLNFGTATGAVATADSDLDGVNNYDEYIADTQPTNSLSFFDNIITNMTGGNVIVLQAGPPTSDQRVYDAWYTTNLVAGSWTPYGLAVPGNGDGSAVILSVTNDVEGRFYRTGVRLP